VQLLDAATGAVRATTTTESDGTYSFSGVATGNFLVRATRGGQSKDSPTVTVSRTGGSFAVATINLVQQTISGTLTLNGAAAGGGIIRLVQGTTVVASTTTGTNGTYQFGGVFSGSYTVTASLSGATGSRTISVASGANATVLNIALTATVATPAAADFVVGRIYQISIPFADTADAFATTTVARAFTVLPRNASGGTNYILYKFDAANQAKIFITDGNAQLRRGEGYFIEPRSSAVSLKKVASDATRVPTSAVTFVVTLRKSLSLDDPTLSVSQQNNGYNLIGFPFDPARYSVINWLESSVDVAAGTRADGTQYPAAHFDTIREAVAAGVMSDELFTLKDDNTRTYDSVTQLVPFKGYYVRTYLDNVNVTLKAVTR